MRVIHKQVFAEENHVSHGPFGGGPSYYDLSMDLGAQILKVAEQHGEIAVWYECDGAADAPVGTHRFQVVPTGGQVPEHPSFEYLDTVLLGGGRFVFHVYYNGTLAL